MMSDKGDDSLVRPLVVSEEPGAVQRMKASGGEGG